ncbi:hypothetical protein C7C46_03735 [Streptomyces tateyamensis]|uniref:Uncharacterized protein n=1 Tax=Streptomyces tateyamensis TaxID=565073 RepID=A0A2V4NN60_9ACTN|nr:hypothetical protein [Streptomyces tateyamensis]PYC87640.1 hypothetical protein C7C46_03735 [Streptomyces tateyamensis]
MALTNRAPRVRTATALLTAAGAAVTTGLLLPGQHSAAVVPPGSLASATLVQLTTQDVPAIGLTAYAGSYASAVSTTVPGTENADFSSDPDDMLSRITIATRTTRTATDPAKYYAQAQLTGLEVRFKSKALVSFGPVQAGTVASLDSYAECVPPPVGPYALAYNRTNGGRSRCSARRSGWGPPSWPSPAPTSGCRPSAPAR